MRISEIRLRFVNHDAARVAIRLSRSFSGTIDIVVDERPRNTRVLARNNVGAASKVSRNRNRRIWVRHRPLLERARGEINSKDRCLTYGELGDELKGPGGAERRARLSAHRQ